MQAWPKTSTIIKCETDRFFSVNLLMTSLNANKLSSQYQRAAKILILSLRKGPPLLSDPRSQSPPTTRPHPRLTSD